MNAIGLNGWITKGEISKPTDKDWLDRADNVDIPVDFRSCWQGAVTLDGWRYNGRCEEEDFIEYCTADDDMKMRA